MRELRWSDDTEAHIWRHRVRPGEVEEVVSGRPRLVLPGRLGTELVLGRTDDGRYLLVVLAAHDDVRDGVVTAREMTSAERRQFRRKGH